MQRPTTARTLALVVLVSALVGLTACEEQTITDGQPAESSGTGPRPPPPPPPQAGAGGAGGAAGEAAAGEVDAGVAPLSYRDEDFVEADTNRDPFRSFAAMFTAQPTREPVQREVIMARTPVDDMRLIAIISGVADPSAMLVDREGTGHTVHRGDYVGRADIVQTGGSEGVPVTLNWRVDRIREGEVVLTREDPTAPNRPPLTRVITLHEAEVEAER